MENSSIICYIRDLRRLVSTLDSIGFPIEELANDPEFSKLVSSSLPTKINKISTQVHQLVQKIEKSKKYKEAVKVLQVTEIGDI